VNELTTVLKSDLPLNEKVGKVGVTVQERVTPLLEAATVRVQETIKAATTLREGYKENQQPSNTSSADGLGSRAH
jgi:hypothetical protein